MFKTTFLFILLNALVAVSSFAADCPRCSLPEDPSADVFEPRACIGPTMTSVDAARKFCGGTDTANLGHFKYVLRWRHCNRFTGCDGWAYAPAEKFLSVTNSSGASLPADEAKLGGYLRLRTTTRGVIADFNSVGAYTDGRGLSHGEIHFASSTELPATSDKSFIDATLGITRDPNYNVGLIMERFYGANRATVIARGLQFTDHCARFVASAKTAEDANGAWLDFHFGALTRY